MNDDALQDAGLVDAQGAICDLAARKVFSVAQAMWNHPIATHMARLVPRTRLGLAIYLGIARDIPSGWQIKLGEFPWGSWNTSRWRAYAAPYWARIQTKW